MLPLSSFADGSTCIPLAGHLTFAFHLGQSICKHLTGETFGTEDPRTGEIYTQVAEAQEADVDEAVKAARQVQTGLHNSLAACLCNTLG